MPTTPSGLRHHATALMLAAAGLLLASCSSAGPSSATGTVEVRIFGASSTRVINDELAAAARRLDPPLDVKINNDGSGTLVTQLLEGAPADVLITADRRSMDRALADGTVGSPQELAHNSMVMVVPAGNPADVGSVADFADEGVDLVLCDPRVPCGEVSERLIDANGLRVHPVSLEGAVGDVLGKVQNGEADAGWVYRSDARAAGGDVEIIEIPQAADFPNTLFVAVATASPHPAEARRIVDLLLSEEITAALADAGFIPAA
ncbi:molybdate ABC transporter substrate-binding protein [Corynebacterium guangdongense]|uniref:Molybdate transport system substrate-binding protein n=1 Tax=Corynebacterium guangdongense TaxID=1783348 RepID=A0ABU1ZVY6_9CORY|nr:molybdate ABC transporter substrate-binding protein [Corynebacterium guangdongense]MDR7329091.1 molybdate transport system substrate-binding protein [Corynebacterium guangdongense]WJZ17660.1 Molybdate-binding periplasmic protein precursor [Corynebacterium guangdongense]